MTKDYAQLRRDVSQGSAAGPITKALVRWDGVITESAVKRVNEQRLKDLSGDRSDGEGRFRGSLLGSCHRQQMLSYRGYIGEDAKTTSREIMRDGTYRHYFWQEVGLSAGFLLEIEHYVTYEPWHFGGQLDGLMSPVEEFGGVGGFELKTTNEATYAQVLSNKKPLEKHLKQIGAYCEAANLDWFSVVYESRSYKVDWVEYVVFYDDELKALTRNNIEALLDYERHELLPPMLPGYPSIKECKSWCSFDKICPHAKF